MNIKSFPNPYTPEQDWPDDVSIETTTGSFKIFLHELETFIIRSAGDTSTSEWLAFQDYSRFMNCKKHKWVYSFYEDGSGVCQKCGMYQSDVLPPLTKCSVCGSATAWRLHDNQWYCEDHDPIKEK